MAKVDKTVLKETKYIAFVVFILSLFMNALFLVFRNWDYKVLLGNVLSGGVAVLNFFLMGITVQKALEKTPEDARKLMKASQSMRNLATFVIVGVGALLPIFNILTLIAPLFFPKIAVFMRPLWKDKKDREVINGE